jgi:LysM repeat protein
MNKGSAQNVISAYRKRQQMGPFLIGGLAILLIIVGILVLVLWLSGSKRPAIALFPSQTATVTVTSTNTPVTPTITETITPTITSTATITITQTPNGPFEYVVQEGDTCYGLAVKYKADLNVIIALNPAITVNCIIKPGDKLLIPVVGQQLPTMTPLPTGLKSGTRIKYTVLAGETLGGIAYRFNTTVAAILADKDNAAMNGKTAINAGQVITIPINTITQVPTATIGTPHPTLVGASATSTKPAAAAATATPTKKP